VFDTPIHLAQDSIIKGVFKPSDVDPVWLSAVSALPYIVTSGEQFFVAHNPIDTITTEYFDQTIEPKGACCSDPLWRLVKLKRGGPRGCKQKVTHLVKGIESGHYVDREPYICQTGWQYAKDWGFTVVLDVYNPHYITLSLQSG